MKFLIISIFTILFLFSQDTYETNLSKLINDINTTSQSPTYCRWEYSRQEKYHIFNYLCKQEDKKIKKNLPHLVINFSYKRIKTYKIFQNNLIVIMTPYRRHGLERDRKILIHHAVFIKNYQAEHYATGVLELGPALLIDGDILISIQDSMLNLK